MNFTDSGRNNDKATFIVMPLTSAPNGVGVNKIKLGAMNSLPSSLKTNDTYAVYNQVRTVNADRFIALKEGSAVKECPMEKHIFHKLLFLGLREMVYSIPQEERIEILKSVYEAELISKAKDMAYQIVKLRKEEIPDKKQIDEFLIQINETIKGVTYSLDKQLVKDGIDAIFYEAKNL
ncbi:hypothetical protein ASU35_18055 [Acetivibrio ethanolgignens]|uniref:Uncharacterized protein n=1 Tax=Acetivibrio ethanolgignens TaxID=290052 RepID=A0A0V8QGE7_9FIRM|nr:hypothetical protein ASU35_18055 [Acetivibrio ethanolgignens]